MTYASPDPARDGAAQTSDTSAPRRGLGCALEIVETLVLTLVIYLLIHNFIAQPFEVEQDSMVPTVLAGEYVLIDKVSPRFSDYERGDIVVFNPPPGYSEGDEPYINRDINGRPEPTLIKDAEGTASWKVPAGSYFVMGDNRTVSQDSRVFGPITRDLIIGRAWLRYFPLNRIGLVRRPAYAGLEERPSSPSPTARARAPAPLAGIAGS